MNIAELGGSLDRAGEFVTYFADLGVNAIEVIPLSDARLREGTGEVAAHGMGVT